MKVLVTRTDRLGDLVVSLPAVVELKRARPDWEVHLMVAPGARPLVEHSPELDGLWTWNDDLTRGARRALEEDLRREGFDAAVLLQYRRELADVLRRAGIGRRYGPRSKLTSWFLLNRGTWQARSRRDRHEGEFSLELLRKLVPDLPRAPATPRLHLGPEQRDTAASFRAERAASAEHVAFVHPGSSGSALDWAPGNFVRVANALAARPGWRVFVTGDGKDARRLAPVRGELADAVADIQNEFALPAFLAVLAAGDVFVGPSTGPLHMAAALDLAAVGLYPPVPTMAPSRWGPRGRWCRTVVPAVDCPAGRTCRRERCDLYNCMERIACAEVIETAVALAGRRRDEGPPPRAAAKEPS